MLLEELAGKRHSTEKLTHIHPKHLMMEIEVHRPKDTGFFTGNGTLISSDGWVLTARHVVEQCTNAPFEFLHIYDQGNYKYPVQDVLLDSKADLALVKLQDVYTEPFQLSFNTPERDESIQIHSLMNRSTHIQKGKMYITKFNYDCEQKKLNTGLACRVRTTEGQSGSLIVNAKNEIIGLVSHASDNASIHSGFNHFSYGPRSDSILRFIRKVYRST